MGRYKVNRCICYKKSFAEISEYARSKGYKSASDLKKEKYCCDNCGLCTPYVDIMLKTGKTEFNSGFNT